MDVALVLPVGGVGEDAFAAREGAGCDVPDVALVIGGYVVGVHEVAEQILEGFQLRRGVPLVVLEATVLLVGTILVDVRHCLALEVGDNLAVLPCDGVELPVGVLYQRTPAVQLNADGVGVEFAVVEAELGEVVGGEAEVVRPVLVIEASVQMPLAADDVGGGHPLRGVKPPRHVAVHAVAGDGVVQHYLSLFGRFPDVLALGEVPVLVYLDHCSLVLVVLVRRSSRLSRAAFLSMMSSRASRMR